MREKYKEQVVAVLEQLLVQQHDLLRSLGKQLLTPIIKHDKPTIISSLLVYADYVFILSKHGYTIPVQVQLVSLTAPQQIISGLGILDKKMLAPDEKYYLQVVSEPNTLNLSALYTMTEMPEHVLLNMGLGILDKEYNYLGHLDARVSLSAIDNYIRSRLTIQSKNFDFSLMKSQTLIPDIKIKQAECYVDFFYYCIARFILVWVSYVMLMYCIRLYKNYKQQTLSLEYCSQQIQELNANVSMHKLAAETQYRYGILSACKNKEGLGLLDLQQLLVDVQAVNAELAMIRQISINTAEVDKIKLMVRANQLRLMQILSGILYEVIMQLPVKSTINIQFSISVIQHNLHKFVFKFIDDGFYTELVNNQIANSSADIRAKGWSNIKHLIELEQGVLDYTHIPYSGNVVSLTISCNTENNVVSLENYFSEV